MSSEFKQRHTKRTMILPQLVLCDTYQCVHVYLLFLKRLQIVGQRQMLQKLLQVFNVVFFGICFFLNNLRRVTILKSGNTAKNFPDSSVLLQTETCSHCWEDKTWRQQKIKGFFFDRVSSSKHVHVQQTDCTCCVGNEEFGTAECCCCC